MLEEISMSSYPLMGVDVSNAGRLGLEALAELKSVVDTSRNTAILSAKWAAASNAAANKADQLIAYLAKTAPADVGERVFEWAGNNLSFDSVSKALNAAKGSTGLTGPQNIELASMPHVVQLNAPRLMQSSLGDAMLPLITKKQDFF
jgi:hypothetical protein